MLCKVLLNLFTFLINSPTKSPTHKSPVTSPIKVTKVTKLLTPAISGSSTQKRRLRAEEIEGLDEYFAKRFKEASFSENEEISRLNTIILEQEQINVLTTSLREVEGKLDSLRNSLEDALYFSAPAV